MANEIDKINTNFQPGANTETMTPDVTPTVQTKEPWAIQVKRPDETVYKLGIAPETKKQSFVEYVSSDPKTRQSLSEFISVNNQKAINGAVPLDKLPGGSDLYKNSTGWTTSLYTPERLAQIKSMPKIGMAEAFGMLNKWEMFPYINGVALAEDVKVFNIMKRLKENPDNVTAQDKDYAYKFLDEMAQMELRGLSFGGNMIYYGLRMPAYAIEFAGAVSAIGGLGTAAREATELTVKQGLKATVKEVAKGAVKAGGKGLLATVTPVAKFGGLTVPNVAMLARPAKNYYQRRLNDSISITDKGEVLYKEATEKPAMTMLKSFGDTWIENSSEMAGAFLFKPITGAVGRNLPKGFGTGFKALVEKTTGFKYAKAIAKFGGYDGMLEELGEERVGDFLRTALNLENKGYSFDAFGQALFPDWDQLQVELGLISIYGGASYAMGNLATKLSKDKSPQEVEQIMKQVSSLSQKESEKMVNQLNNIETEKDVQEYNQKIQDFKDMVGENVPRETLDANIAIWDNMINVLANKTGKTRSELADELPIVKSMKQGELQGLFQGEAPMFYSNLQKTLSEKMPEKATAEQVRGIIKDIKQEEKDWSGIEDYLKDNPKASKQDLLNYLKANEVKLEEITKGKIVDVMSPEFGADSPYKKSLHEKYNALTTTKLRELATQEELAKMDEEIRLSEKNKTKFEQWQLSGGENYREVLMTLPTAGGVVKPKIEKIEQMSPQTKDGVTRTGYAVTLDTGLVLNFRNAVSDRDAVTSAHAQIESGLVPIKGEGFKSSHWEEKNVLAHFRLNDRIDSDGKKVLFIEEIQSDWHQEGRKKGYVIENAESYEGYLETLRQKYNIKRDEYILENIFDLITKEEKNKLTDLFDNPNIRKVPNAPFKKTWHELAFKRIVREGVEKGYDKIGWTTGQQQADRYDLSKQLNSIQYDPINTNLKAYDKNDNLVINKGVTKDELEDNIGKDATRKLFEKENTHINKFGNAYLHTLEGIDLKVGGEGMKGFYDKILVDYANKFGKKFGTKVEDIEIKRQDGQFKLSKEGKQIDSDIVHGLEITPQMKESVMAGQSLFQGAKGAFNAKNNIIALFETADRSTFLHESAHAFFEMYLKHLPAELDTVMKWAGFEGKKIEDLTDKQYVKLQESFARGFEIYLREGKAPSMKLADAFESFKEWLTNIYETVQSLIETAGLKIKLSDDIRNFYDEMLAVPADRVATIDENVGVEDLGKERDLTLFQSIQKKIEELKQSKKDIVKKFKQKIDMKKEALDFIKGMNINAEDKARLLGRIDTVKTEGSFKKVMSDLYDMEQKYWEKKQRNILDERIEKLLKQTKPAKQGAVVKGKYEYEFNKLFEELRDISKLTKDEAKSKLLAETSMDDTDGVDLTSENKLRRLILGWRAYGKSELTLEGFQEAHSQLQNAIAVAKESQSEKDFKEKLELSDKKDAMVKAINEINFKGDRDALATKIINLYRNNFADYYGLLNSIAGKKIADEYSLDISEKDKAAEIDATRTAQYEEIADILGVGNKYEVEKYFDKLNSTKYELFETGRTKAKEISTWELIDIYNSIKNEKTRKSYYDYYGQEQIDSILSNLTTQDIAIADYLMEQVQSMYDIVNATHIKQYGIDLGKVDNYWPRKSELTEKEPYQEYRQASQIASYQKQRAEGNRPVPQNAFLVMSKHIDNAIHQKNIFDKWYLNRKIFGSKRVKNAIEDKYGEDIASKMKETIDTVSLNANNQNLDNTSRFVLKMLSNWTGAKILLNASIAPKQFIGAFNYIENMPVAEFSKNFIEGILNPKKTAEFMFENSSYVNARFKQGADDIAQNIMKKGEAIAKSRKITDYLSFFIRVGDSGAVVYGGYPYVKHLMDQGMSKQDAFKKFEEQTIRTQQAGFQTSLAGYQRNVGMKFFTAFKNAQTQMMRRVVNAMIQYNNGEISKAQLGKTITLYTVVQPALFGAIALAWRQIVMGTGDDDGYAEEMLASIFTNLLAPIPLVADLSQNFIDAMISFAKGESPKWWTKQMSFPLLTDVAKISGSTSDIIGAMVTDDEIDFEDVLTTLSLGAEIFKGIPVGNVVRQTKGILRLE